MIAFSIILANAVGILVHFMNKQLDRWINWRQLFFSRFFIGFIITLTAACSFIFLIGYLTVAIVYQLNVSEFYLRWQEEIWKLGILSLIILFIYEVFYGWFYSYRYYASTQVDKLKSDRLQMELQYESLKSQISPHYLFNCLNTISSLLYKDTLAAEEFIRRMADTFRYVIDNHNHKLVLLSDELAFVKSYYYLMKVRYKEHLKLEINIPSGVMDTLVPPLTIQMLIENAVKHNDISKEHEVFIYVFAQDNTKIIVSSTKTKSSDHRESFHVGLTNIKNRYSFFTKDKVNVKDGEKFVVELPVIKPVLASRKQFNGNVNLMSSV